jgi:hypothetical protein
LEIATGINYPVDGPTVRCIGTSGREGSLPIEALARAGLPGMEGSRRKVKTDLRGWQPCSFEEYSYAIGRPIPDGSQHTAWSFFDGSARFVVPCLALLRELAKPTNHLLSHMFRPQSLDDLCVLDSRAALPTVAVLGSLGLRRDRLYDKLEQRLLWLTSFPSARRAWASVYHAAKQGRIDIALPQASMDVVASYIKHGNNHYVVRLGLCAVNVHEEPFPFATGAPSYYNFVNERARESLRLTSRSWATNQPKLRLDIPAHADGTTCVTEAEWEAIQAVLPMPRRKNCNPRASLDAILSKLANGAPWLEVKYPGTDRPAPVHSTFRRWQSSGRWDEILRVLERMRKTC